MLQYLTRLIAMKICTHHTGGDASSLRYPPAAREYQDQLQAVSQQDQSYGFHDFLEPHRGYQPAPPWCRTSEQGRRNQLPYANYGVHPQYSAVGYQHAGAPAPIGEWSDRTSAPRHNYRSDVPPYPPQSDQMLPKSVVTPTNPFPGNHGSSEDEARGGRRRQHGGDWQRRRTRYSESSDDSSSEQPSQADGYSTQSSTRNCRDNGSRSSNFHIRLPPFTGQEPWKVYFNRFEDVAQLNRLDRASEAERVTSPPPGQGW